MLNEWKRPTWTHLRVGDSLKLLWPTEALGPANWRIFKVARIAGNGAPVIETPNGGMLEIATSGALADASSWLKGPAWTCTLCSAELKPKDSEICGNCAAKRREAAYAKTV